MGLYDGYRLANSNRVKEYQGSAVPEMVQVSQELQHRSDTADNTLDYSQQYLNSMTSLHQDQEEFNKVKTGITDKLTALGKRPDHENIVRETAMLAQQLPQQYAPFAQRIKDAQEVQEGYNKRVADGKMDPTEAKVLMQRDIDMDGGIRKDPTTGKYNGRFVAQQTVDTFDRRKATDEIFEKMFPTTNGWSNEWVGDQWIHKNGFKTVTMDKSRIADIVASGLAINPGYTSWAKQQEDLATYKMNYSRDALKNVDGNEILGYQKGADTKDKKGRIIHNTVPITLQQIMQHNMEQKIDPMVTLKSIRGRQVQSKLLNEATDYVQKKYERHDRNIENSISENPFFKWGIDREETSIQYEGAGIDLSGTMPSDPKKVTESIQTTTTQIGDLTKLISSGQLDNVQRAKAESQRDMLIMGKSKLESFNKTVSAEVVTKMGYDYTKLQTLKSGSTPMTLVDGQKTTVGDLTTASENNGSFTDGNIDKTKPYIKTVDPSDGYGANAKAYLVSPDGKEHEITHNDFTTMMGHKDEINRYQTKYNDMEAEVTKDKALNFSVTPKVISFSKGIRESVNRALKTGNPGIVVMDSKGANLEDSDIPQDLVVNGITSEKIGDNHYMDASVESSDKKTKEKYKNTRFYVKMVGENSIAEDAARNMLRDENPQIRATGEDILSNKYKNLLNDKLRDNQSVDVPVKGYGNVTVENSVIDGIQSYRMLDSKGNLLNIGGAPAISSNLSNIGKALKHLEK